MWENAYGAGNFTHACDGDTVRYAMSDSHERAGGLLWLMMFHRAIQHDNSSG